MKKYLASLIPFLACSVFSFIYAIMTSKDISNPSNPYQTEGTLAYLSITWFYIGIIISAIFISMFIINDVFDWFTKAIERKRMDRQKGT
ncbi:MAG TPA: hypothetical protein VFG19_12520 [Geobacteraceae bacterium]|nr:hypothetical protein [Geobacteraceae bacterium]